MDHKNELRDAWRKKLNLLAVFDLNKLDYYLPEEKYLLPVLDAVTQPDMGVEDPRFKERQQALRTEDSHFRSDLTQRYQIVSEKLNTNHLLNYPPRFRAQGKSLFQKVTETYETLMSSENYQLEILVAGNWKHTLLWYISNLQTQSKTNPPPHKQDLVEFLIRKSERDEIAKEGEAELRAVRERYEEVRDLLAAYRRMYETPEKCIEAALELERFKKVHSLSSPEHYENLVQWTATLEREVEAATAARDKTEEARATRERNEELLRRVQELQQREQSVASHLLSILQGADRSIGTLRRFIDELKEE